MSKDIRLFTAIVAAVLFALTVFGCCAGGGAYIYWRKPFSEKDTRLYYHRTLPAEPEPPPPMTFPTNSKQPKESPQFKSRLPATRSAA